MKKAVLFDYDGVFADTMREMFQAWNHSLKLNENVGISEHEFFLMEGYTAQKIAESFCIKYKFDARHIEKIIKDKEDYYLKNHKFKLYRGVKELIFFLKEKKLLIAIVSGAPKARIKKMIGTKLFNKFDYVVGAGDVGRGKPHPDPYRNVLETFNILPSEAIVIENAPLGIKSAVAAGIYCLAIESTLDKKYLQDANKIFKNFDELFLYFKSIF